MALYNRWKKDGTMVMCERIQVKKFEALGYILRECPEIVEEVVEEVEKKKVVSKPRKTKTKVEKEEDIKRIKDENETRVKAEESVRLDAEKEAKDKIVEAGPDIVLG